jgi:hypothetical protein
MAVTVPSMFIIMLHRRNSGVKHPAVAPSSTADVCHPEREAVPGWGREVCGSGGRGAPAGGRHSSQEGHGS